MKMRLIIKREYMERVRSKWFLIGTLLAPLLISSIILIPIAIAKFSSTQKKIAVLDNSRQEQLLDRVVAKLQKDSGQDRLTIEAEKVDDTELQTRQAVLNARVEKGELQGYLLLSKQTVEQGTAEYYAKNVTDFVAIRQLSEALTKAVVERRLEMDGMDPARVEQLSKSVDLQTKKLQRGEAKVDRGQSFVLAFVLMMLIYVMLIAYGMTVLQSVVEEKQNRIVEVIISSVKPVELLFGKVIGIGLVGLTQLTIWLLFSLLMPTALASTVASIKTLMPDISPLLLVYFVIYFVLGYFLYASLYAMVGALVSSEQDAQNLQAPVTLLLVIPIVISQFIIRDPNSTLAVVFSLFPFFSPIVMFLRITIQTPPFWQIALSVLLLALSIVLCSWIGGKIYRVGILMYGKRPSLPELVRWLKYT